MMLVSAIMPTRGRAQFAAEALACFQAQTWPHREIVIIDDDDAPSFAKSPEGALYYRMPRRMTIGAKRNLACSRASGDVLIHFDDDDWSAPGRMEDQVRRLVDTGAQVTGYNVLTYEHSGERWQYRGHPGYAVGATLCYTREFWRANPFRDINVGEDNDFLHRARHVVCADAGAMMLARMHAGNTSPKVASLKCDCWRRVA